MNRSVDGGIPAMRNERTDMPVVASFDDPHLEPLAKNPRRAEQLIGLVLFLGLLGVAAYGALYWVGGQPQWEGIFLGGGMFLIGLGLSSWGKYLLPKGPFVEERHPLASTTTERTAMRRAISDRGRIALRRRGFLGTLLAGALGVFGIVITFPLIRSLGPRPGTLFDRTAWRRGSRLVDFEGRPVAVTDLEVGGSLTVFPEGTLDNEVDLANSQVILVRPASTDIVTRPGRETWGPQGYLAYSKVCTHAGCPVGLYQEQTQQLLCPCHQSVFDVLDGAEPVFGPAPRPLPQLPLYVDDEGYLRAQHGFDEPVGPGFWERS
jgi:ubiquinol-cytochrome c reductase iron-sulfur subunit